MALPAHRMNLADGETFTCKVFRDHPAWDQHAKWWQLPMHLANELFVCAYDCGCLEHLDYIEKQHPGCVFVY